MSRSWSLGLCLATFLTSAAFGQQAAPARPDPKERLSIEMTRGMMGDLAGVLMRFSSLCDPACHLIIARALVALDSAVPVEAQASARQAPKEPPPKE